MISFRPFVIGLLVVMIPQISKAAEPAPDWRAVTRTLLETTWDKKLDSRERADTLFEEARRLSQDNSFPLAAYWLVLLQQGRTQDAAKRLDEYLRTEPNHLTALRMRVRLHVIARDYARAVTVAGRIATRIGELAAAKPGEPTADEAESLRFLGRLLGFLERPLASTYDQRERAEFQTRLLGGLDESRKALVEQGRQEVFMKYDELKDGAASAAKDAAEAAAQLKEKKKADLEKTGANLDEDARKLEGKMQAVKSEVGQSSAVLDQQEQRLAAEFARQSARASLLSSDSTIAQNQASRLQADAQREQDPQRRLRSQQAAAEAMARAQRIQSELERVSATVDSIEREVNGIRTKKKLIHKAAVGEASRIAAAEQKLNKEKTRNEAAEKRLNRPGEVGSGQAESLTIQARAFTTYEPLLLDELREKLLAALTR